MKSVPKVQKYDNSTLIKYVLPISGAHFHRENLVDVQAMSVISQTSSELASHDATEQNMDSNITIRPQVCCNDRGGVHCLQILSLWRVVWCLFLFQILGKRRCPFEPEDECLIRWYPRL